MKGWTPRKTWCAGLEIRPEDGYIQDSLGFVLYKKGRTRDAIVILEKAYRTKPSRPVIAEHLGMPMRATTCVQPCKSISKPRNSTAIPRKK